MSDKHSQFEKLNTNGLFEFARLFAHLPAPDLASTIGTWRAAFVVPAWLRWLVPSSLTITVLAKRAMSLITDI